MNILFAVITCNRLHYLKNCVKSVHEFVDLDNADLMIIDNCTVEEGADEYLRTVDAKVKRFTDRVPNELYRAMNYAIRYCMKNKIEIVNFVQDDYQFVYKLDSLLPTVRKCFKKHANIGQINCNMAWKRKRISNKWPVLTVGKTNFRLLDDKNLVDNGFTRVNIYKKTGLYPTGVISYDQNSKKTFGFDKNRYKKTPNGELWFGAQCRKLGYVRAASLLPNQTMMFDCAYVRKWDRFGNYFPPPHQYYIKPFDKDKIEQVKSNHHRKRFSFIEQMSEPWGWKPTTFDKHNRQKIVNEIKHG